MYGLQGSSSDARYALVEATPSWAALERQDAERARRQAISLVGDELESRVRGILAEHERRARYERAARTYPEKGDRSVLHAIGFAVALAAVAGVTVGVDRHFRSVPEASEARSSPTAYEPERPNAPTPQYGARREAKSKAAPAKHEKKAKRSAPSLEARVRTTPLPTADEGPIAAPVPTADEPMYERPQEPYASAQPATTPLETARVAQEVVVLSAPQRTEHVAAPTPVTQSAPARIVYVQETAPHVQYAQPQPMTAPQFTIMLGGQQQEARRQYQQAQPQAHYAPQQALQQAARPLPPQYARPAASPWARPSPPQFPGARNAYIPRPAPPQFGRRR